MDNNNFVTQYEITLNLMMRNLDTYRNDIKWLLVSIMLCVSTYSCSSTSLYDVQNSLILKRLSEIANSRKIFNGSELVQSLKDGYEFKFKHHRYNVTIPENNVGKTYASLASNGDCLCINVAPSYFVNFQIVSAELDDIFKIEQRTVGNVAFFSVYTEEVILNREKMEEYYLRIKATLASENEHKKIKETDVHINLRVLDRNDLSPLFYPSDYSIVIPEDMPAHKSILKVSAEDADFGMNGEVYYSLQNGNENFAIHPTSGVITLARCAEHLQTSQHELNVLAIDRSSALFHRFQQASKAHVTIFIEPVNLHAPEIFVKMMRSVMEETKTTVHGVIRVVDKDTGVHGEIKKIEIVAGDPNGHFHIIPSKTQGEYYIELRQYLGENKVLQGYNITLLAEDKGTPTQSSYKTFPIQIKNIYDFEPIFNRQIYEVSISEICPPNTPIIRLKVNNSNKNQIRFVRLEIVGGNEGEEFHLNPNTGMLYTKKFLDTEIKSFYTLTVSAIDQKNIFTRKQSSAKVKINIQDSNDNDPVFNPMNETIWISENEFAGAFVAKVSAKDKDSGENSYISFNIANLNYVPFEIDHFSGIIRTLKTIDYETMQKVYILSIRASDWGLPFRRQTEIKLVIKVRDINDNRPQFERFNCTGILLRTIPINTEIFTVSAIDLDADDRVKYQMVSGNEDGCFNLDAKSGIIYTGCDFTDAGFSYRQLNVTSTDGTHFSDVMTIHLYLNKTNKKTLYRTENKALSSYGKIECHETGVAQRKVNMHVASEESNMPHMKYNSSTDIALVPSRYGENIHAPEFFDFPAILNVNESALLGETLVWIKAKDRDLGYNGKVVFGISGGDPDSVFRIDVENGELELIGYLDREKQDEFLLNITVYDLGRPQKLTSKTLPVNIIDSNDNYPVFEKLTTKFHISEDVSNGTVISFFKATDADLGKNADIVYSLLSDTKSFAIHPKNGSLYTISRLDRETIDFYELQIMAKDNGSPSLSSVSIAVIVIEDVNDNPPKILLPDFIFRIREDLPIETVVATVTATDIDKGLNSELFYTLLPYQNDTFFFKIDESTGILRTRTALDFEEHQIHTLVVLVVDKGKPQLTAEATLIIEIIDINENRFAPEFSDYVFSGQVLENKAKGTYVMNISATDSDMEGSNSEITYSIRGGDGIGSFSIGQDGIIRTLNCLDADSKSWYWLTVCAQDGGVVPLHSCVQVYIEVENENDNVPLTEEPAYYVSVLEESPIGVHILQLTANDDDNDPKQHITYRIISGNPEGFFSINSTTGLIVTTARKLDRENQCEHTLEVLLEDSGSPQLSSTTRVVIEVNDVNDQTPVFEQQFYKVQILKNTSIGAPLFQVLAFDDDFGNNGRLTYSIKSGKGRTKFRIDSNKGIIYAAKPIESESEFDITVRAEDNGNIKRSATAGVNILVIPAPKGSIHPPVIKTTNMKTDVTESDRPGFLVTLIQSTDEDNDQLWYSIIGGDLNNNFYIGRDNGNVLLAKALDWEAQSSFNLSISVTDGIFLTTTQLYINVIDVNDNRPEFIQTAYAIDLYENIEKNSEILQLKAFDLDEDKKLFYTLHAARDPISLNLFRIDSLSGKVIVTQPLDREKISEHILIAIVKDQGTPAKRSYARIIIRVQDHNDHYPEFTSKILQAKVLENAAIGSNVFQLFAVDNDLGENAKITYSIVSGNTDNMFEVDSVMGTVSVKKELNIDVTPEYILQIKASDQGFPSLSSQIPLHIIVTMTENDDPHFFEASITVEIFENLPRGSYVTHIRARSMSSMFFEIVDGNTDDCFEVNPSTGLLTTKDFIDFETMRFYNLTIVVRNMASFSSNVSVIIHVLDKNDNVPYFLKSEYCGKILESAEIGIVVQQKSCIVDSTITNSPLLIQAKDADSGLNGLLNFNIVEEIPRKYFHIDSATGAVKLMKVLDYEKIAVYNFNVLVTDLGNPKLGSLSAAKVKIYIEDVNDAPPLFEDIIKNITLFLPTFNNVIVTKASAKDLDSSENTELRYDIIDGNTANAFSVDSKTGTITTRDVRNPENFYGLRIRASDGLYSSVSHVNIHVKKSANSKLRFQKYLYECVTPENSTKIHTIALLTVLGADLGEHVEFRILNPTTMFSIGITSGALKTTGEVFDREVCESYQLKVEARILSKVENTAQIAHALVNITILDVNDNCPIFVNLPYYAIASVDDTKGSFLIKVHAIDHDSAENGEVRYEMKKGHGELFKVDRKSGEIFLKQGLESHNKEYELIIAAYDGGVTPCSTNEKVHVKVVDKSMPVFEKQFYSETVKEDASMYSPLSLDIKAESHLNRKLIYTIIKGNDFEIFNIDFNIGSMRLTDTLDYEQRKSYDLEVQATDSVTGISATIPVSIKVEDVNDCYPKIEKDIYNVSISEGTIFGTIILKVNATDYDEGSNGQVSFFIESTTNGSAEFFHIDPTEGILYLKTNLDRELMSTHYLTVIAKDHGLPSLSTTAHIWITVSDINDNVPKFEEASYNCFVSPSASSGHFITTLRAFDPDSSDKSHLIYKIIGGNILKTYEINNSTGFITLKNLRNFGEERNVVLNVSVSDGIYTSFTRVKINLIPENLHTPFFPRAFYEASVMENQLPGEFVISVAAVDSDYGIFGAISYEILSDRFKEYFRLNSDTGILETKLMLDREEDNFFEIPVAAKDGGGRIGFTTVFVNVLDENDNAPQFDQKEYKSVVKPTSQETSLVLKVHAADLDYGANKTVKYSILNTSMNTKSDDLFSIDADTGSIFLKKKIKLVSVNQYQLYVRASDGGFPMLYNDVPVFIFVIKEETVIPYFEKKYLEIFVSELAPIGSLLATLQLIVNFTGTFSLISDLDEPNFEINQKGELYLTKSLDREKCDKYLISIVAENKEKLFLFATNEMILHVQDENDNPPQFEMNSYELLIDENTKIGTNIIKVVANDADIGKNGIVKYQISNTNNFEKAFAIDMNTGWIAILTTLDKETQSEYQFIVEASDSGYPVHIAKTTVTIKLFDCNDNPPKFEMKYYDTSVDENALPGTVLTQLFIIDEDSDHEKLTIVFLIVGGDQKLQFQIRQTGELFLSKKLDREDVASYNLSVIATDGKFIAETFVLIEVNDINDNVPICLKSVYKKDILESIPIGTTLFRVIAFDFDESRNEQLRFYLTGLGADDFIIDKESGLFKTLGQIDREKISQYSLLAHVQDHENLSWECVSKIEITIVDLNDNKPKFLLQQYTVTIPENAEIGAFLVKVHAEDKDVGLNRKIIYSISDLNIQHFKICQNTGIITLIKKLDRKDISMYNFSVQAMDQGQPKLSSSSTVLIHIHDINDNPLRFTKNSYLAFVPENADTNTKVIKIEASSPERKYSFIYFSIVEGNEQGMFRIDRSEGDVYVIGELDFEKNREYLLKIQALDEGIPSLSNVITLNISIIDINDNKPKFSQLFYNIVINEGVSVGDEICEIKASDNDSNENAVIKYSIKDGDLHNQFYIDENTGNVSVLSSLDRETIEKYKLIVCAEDNGIPKLSNCVPINIEISDANDNPPLFTKTNYTAFIQEDRELGFVILKFDIFDADISPNGPPFTFDFRAGNGDGVFRLEQDGTLRTAIKFHYKFCNIYHLQIRVFDNGTPPLFSDAWVVVNIVEESRYPPVITPLEIIVNAYQDYFPGGYLGRVHSWDQDQYDILMYDLALTSGGLYSDNLFNISKNDGSLYALSHLDAGDYKLNVTASDGKFTSFALVKISVELITFRMLQNAVSVQFSKITTNDFLLSHRKGFIRSIRSALRVHQKDIIIISVQYVLFNEIIPKLSHTESHFKNESLLETRRNVEVIFSVRKQQVSSALEGYFSEEEIKKAIDLNIENIEETTNLVLEEMVLKNCEADKCANGVCKKRVIVEKSTLNTISTDVISFVSSFYKYFYECECLQGFNGNYCENQNEACASAPCPMHKTCISFSEDNYRCICPKGFSGIKCDRKIEGCSNENCFSSISSISLTGKSYVQYEVNKSHAKMVIEKELSFSLRIRTIQPTGSIMYTSGAIDFNVLEISNGFIQYIFDLGSGETVVRVSSINVSDGEWHYIKLERILNSVKLTVDEKHIAQGNTPGANSMLNLQTYDIFIGAEVKPHPSVLGFEDIQRGFIGCIESLKLGHTFLPFKKALMNEIVILKRLNNIDFTCISTKTLVSRGICGTQPCLNGGTCIEVDYENFECQCYSRFTGQLCQNDLDACASSPCLFGGKCEKQDNLGNFSCECPSKLSGKRCEFGRFCNPNPCKNGGFCEEGENLPHCMCSGFVGEFCDVDIDECKSSPCGKGATCVNEAGSFRCLCPPNMINSSCGDPLYSNSITTKLRNLPLEHLVGITSGIFGVFVVIISALCYIACKNRNSSSDNLENINNGKRKDYPLNSLQLHNSKLVNLENNQRPQSYTPASHENSLPSNTMYVNNLDMLRCYGSAGDELENVPLEYQKLNCTNQVININPNVSNDDSFQKHSWLDRMHLQTTHVNKLNKECKFDHVNYLPENLVYWRSNINISGKTLHTTVPNINKSVFDDSQINNGQYHWDCSDWARHSQNPLPDITEVPGAEFPDSASFQSNESNESQIKNLHFVHSYGAVDSLRDIETLNEEIESEGFPDSENMKTYTHCSFSKLICLENVSQDYDLNSSDTYHRHPNTYLPSFNVASETDDETSTTSVKLLNSGKNELHTSFDKLNESETCKISSKKNNQKQKFGPRNLESCSDIEEDISLINGCHSNEGSTNDIAAQICEIEDSDFDGKLLTQSFSLCTKKRTVSWSKDIYQSDV